MLFLLPSDIYPSNIVHFEGRGVLVDLHAAKPHSWELQPGWIGVCQERLYTWLGACTSTGSEGARQSSETDVESLFYSLLGVASGGQALRWRHLRDTGDIRVFKIAMLEDDRVRVGRGPQTLLQEAPCDVDSGASTRGGPAALPKAGGVSPRLRS